MKRLVVVFRHQALNFDARLRAKVGLEAFNFFSHVLFAMRLVGTKRELLKL